MWRRGEIPKKGDRVIITFDEFIITGTIESIEDRGKLNSSKRDAEPEPNEGWWYDVGISIDASQKGD